ncbi:hypothetical protein M9Y10_044674 [Tritrichomonas musculus]|uniref:Uncharacterized protein n=1 Tax=Tritrichomonas musculus TaxID=1915356 RepID=A0ABR2JT18_9EUKA
MSKTPIKEIKSENTFKETPKARINRTNSFRRSSITPINDKKESNNIPPEDMKRIEREIEARLRLKLKVEYSQRYHLLQDQYDQEMMSSSINMSSSFFDNYSIASSSQSDVNYRSGVSQNELNCQKQKYQEQVTEKQKNIQMLDNIKNELTELLILQEQLQDEQRVLSSQIGEAYSRNSDLIIELSKLREKSNKENKIDDTMSFGLYPSEEKNVQFKSTQIEIKESENDANEEKSSPIEKDTSNQKNKNDVKAIPAPFGNGKDVKMDQIWRKSKLFSPGI